METGITLPRHIHETTPLEPFTGVKAGACRIACDDTTKKGVYEVCVDRVFIPVHVNLRTSRYVSQMEPYIR
jgi:hypothetical protein